MPLSRFTKPRCGSIMSGIMAQTIPALRRLLGLEERPPKVYEVDPLWQS